jgi:hypothetical protein
MGPRLRHRRARPTLSGSARSWSASHTFRQWSPPSA